METAQLIASIEGANKLEDLGPPSKFIAEYKDYAKHLHPDVCSDPRGEMAFKKITEWRDQYENGYSFMDDCGKVKTNNYWINYEPSTGMEKMSAWSVENYSILRSRVNTIGVKYLPLLKSVDAKEFYFTDRSLPINSLTLPFPQEHVRWILNRLLEFSTYVADLNMAHCGLTPDSVAIIPETHGIQVSSFYHMTRVGTPMKTVSAKYAMWYPVHVFTRKLADGSMDTMMCKNIALHLLGATNNNPATLRGKVDDELLTYLMSYEEDSFKSLTTHKEIIKRKYETIFHTLNI